jgi:pimeloyl-ACP methyl ester carboxylesterase
MVNVRKRYTDGLFGQLHVRVVEPTHTSRPPVLCLHVSPLSGLVYEDLMRYLGTDRMVLAPDTPGYGMSDPPPKPPNIPVYAEAFSHLMDSLSLETVDLVGYATGSVIAAELARQRPDVVRRLVLFSAPVIDDEDRRTLGERFGHVIEPQADGSHLLPLWDQVFRGRGPNQTAKLCHHVFTEHIRADGDKKPWAPRAAFEFRLEEALAALTQPMVIYNIATEVHDSTLRAAPFVEPGTIVELPDWGHGFLQTQPENAATLVRDFLDAERKSKP